MGSLKGVEKHNKKKATDAIAKVTSAITELKDTGKAVNFNNVAKVSGVSKNFLYTNEDIRKRLEQLRNTEINRNINNKMKFEKTSKSKDIIIATKDKKIAKLEKEIEILKLQLNNLQTAIYNES